jgi:hypothetical protein
MDKLNKNDLETIAFSENIPINIRANAIKRINNIDNNTSYKNLSNENLVTAYTELTSIISTHKFTPLKAVEKTQSHL